MLIFYAVHRINLAYVDFVLHRADERIEEQNDHF